MKTLIYQLVFLFVFLPKTIFPQEKLSHKLIWGISPGVANYLGEIGGKSNTRQDFVFDLKLSKTRQNISIYVIKPITRSFNLKGQLSYLQISGDDKLTENVFRRARNLNFTNNIYELSFNTELKILKFGKNENGNNLMFYNYIGIGLAGFYHNPTTMYLGKVVNLKPLKTENVNYSNYGLSVPLTTGLMFTIKKRHHIGIELNWRITFTDYLDDISTTYANPENLNPEAVPLSNRTKELNPEKFPPNLLNGFVPGEKRGDPSHNDSYLTLSLIYFCTKSSSSQKTSKTVSEKRRLKKNKNQFTKKHYNELTKSKRFLFRSKKNKG